VPRSEKVRSEGGDWLWQEIFSCSQAYISSVCWRSSRLRYGITTVWSKNNVLI